MRALVFGNMRYERNLTTIHLTSPLGPPLQCRSVRNRLHHVPHAGRGCSYPILPAPTIPARNRPALKPV